MGIFEPIRFNIDFTVMNKFIIFEMYCFYIFVMLLDLFPEFTYIYIYIYIYIYDRNMWKVGYIKHLTPTDLYVFLFYCHIH